MNASMEDSRCHVGRVDHSRLASMRPMDHATHEPRSAAGPKTRARPIVSRPANERAPERHHKAVASAFWSGGLMHNDVIAAAIRRAGSSLWASMGQGGSKNSATSSRQPRPGNLAVERANARVHPQDKEPRRPVQIQPPRLDHTGDIHRN